MNTKEYSEPPLNVPAVPKKLSRTFFGACAVAIILALCFGINTPIAHAGSSGQQLQVICSQATSIVVIGLNQNGNVTTQAFYPDTSGSSTFTTTGWWWIGNVAILVYSPSGNGRFYDSVPQQQNNDTYTTDCNNPPAQYNYPADVDGAMCDTATASPEQTVTCLGAAPLYDCSYPLQQPCTPYLSSAYITQQSNTLACLMNGIQTDLNLDDPANPEANQLSSPYPAFESIGSTTIYWRVWGISYHDAKGVPVYQWFNGATPQLVAGTVSGPYYVTGSMGIGFVCN